MAIFNTNEFLRKTFSKTIFGTAALRPEAVCADGFTLSIQASGMHYCIPNEDLSDGNYSKVELSYLSEEVEEFLPFAEDDEAPLATVYGYVPVETVDAVLAKLSDGTIVQRDLYSAFLLLHLRKNLQSYNKKTIKKDFPQFKKLHDKTKERLKNSHEWLPSSVGF